MKERLALGLFLLSFVIYNLNLRQTFYGDTVPAALLPFSLLIDHTVTLDRFAPWYNERYPGGVYWFTTSRGHVYSSYPVATALLITPLYVPVVALFDVQEWPVERIVSLAQGMEKLVASFLAALSVGVAYALFKRLTEARAALVLTLLFAFGTETWSISSQGLWQHGPGVLLILASLTALHAVVTGCRPTANILLAGLLAGLSVAVRPTNLLFLLACYTALVLTRWRLRQLLLYSTFPALIGAAVATYNCYVFGSIRGFYIHSFGGDPWEGLMGLLVSPSRGLLVYTPVLLFVPVGVWAWFRTDGEYSSPVYTAALLFVPAQVLLLSRWCMWYGGYCYGPRLLTEPIPCLLVLLIPAVNMASRLGWLRTLFVATGVLSVGIQAVGAFCYPRGGWDVLPASICVFPHRLWDWRDNQIIRSVRGGLDLLPYRKLSSVRSDTILSWQSGFFGQEGTATRCWRWCSGQGELSITNTAGVAKTVRLRMSCRTGYERPALLHIESGIFSDCIPVSANRGDWERSFTLPPGQHVVYFHCDAPPAAPVPGDLRIMVFRVEDVALQELE